MLNRNPVAMPVIWGIRLLSPRVVAAAPVSSGCIEAPGFSQVYMDIARANEPVFQ